jgi:2-dehydro-3-deoxy-D-arabinonate dehydratase
MRLGKIVWDQAPRVVLVEEGQVRLLGDRSLSDLSSLLSASDPVAAVGGLKTDSSAIPIDQVQWLPPIDRQEVWAAGVTYKRSQKARMEESEAAADCYWRVYQSPRPELFMKATPGRCSGPGQPLRIRFDATWNVPEPELALVLSPQMKLVGYTIGNDMSSRDIEGENPLYLPQAKVYRQCCGLGPWITLAPAMPPRDQIGISLKIHRQGASVFEGTTQISAMARTFEDLISWLGRENDFPDGAILLQSGDLVEITIDGIGTLSNPIVQDPVPSA